MPLLGGQTVDGAMEEVFVFHFSLVSHSLPAYLCQQITIIIEIHFPWARERETHTKSKELPFGWTPWNPVRREAKGSIIICHDNCIYILTTLSLAGPIPVGRLFQMPAAKSTTSDNLVRCVTWSGKPGFLGMPHGLVGASGLTLNVPDPVCHQKRGASYLILTSPNEAN